jgi:hypothetical protein
MSLSFNGRDRSPTMPVAAPSLPVIPRKSILVRPLPTRPGVTG